jgi:uncharacterized glyoxalase superfamily protein PhnB
MPVKEQPVKAKTPATISALRLKTVAPTLTASDIEASLAFYRDVLGFTVTDEMKEDGRLVGAELQAGNVSLWMSQDDFAKGRDRKKGEGFRLYCTTEQDIDALASAVKARGGRLLEEPHDSAWGSRAFAVADPDGFKMTVMKE